MDHALIPMKTIGPISITGDVLNEEVMVPLATFETTVWPSTNRGAKVSRLSGGIACTIIQDCMARSFAVEATSAKEAHRIRQSIQHDDVAKTIASTSRFAKLEDIHTQQVGKLLFVRISIHSGDASGHNMVTKAADAVMAWLLAQHPSLEYVSVSGNLCTDKKVSAINTVLGRGKSVIADITIPRSVCESVLKTTPEAIVACNQKKNLVGSTRAGSMMSANAHYANLLLATYLATGQDAANIVEGSQGITYAECISEDLYFSVSLPNIIVGTVGHGKHHDFVHNNLTQMGCMQEREPGDNSKRLAAIIAATVLCGEISLIAALTNPGELMRAHHTFERGD